MPPKKHHQTKKQNLQSEQKLEVISVENIPDGTKLMLAICKKKPLDEIEKLLQESKNIDDMAFCQACISARVDVIDIFLEHETCSLSHAVWGLSKLAGFLGINPGKTKDEHSSIQKKLTDYIQQRLTKDIVLEAIQLIKKDEGYTPFVFCLLNVAQKSDLLDKPFLEFLLNYVIEKNINPLIPKLLELGVDVNGANTHRICKSPHSDEFLALELSPLINAALHENEESVTILCQQPAIRIDQAICIAQEEKIIIDIPGTKSKPSTVTPDEIAGIADRIAAQSESHQRKIYPGATALICAAQVGALGVVRLLIKNKVDINAVTLFGETAAMTAIRCGHLKVLELLLQNGASIREVNYQGQTVFDVLQEAKIDLDLKDKSCFEKMTILLQKIAFKNEILIPLLYSIRDVNDLALKVIENFATTFTESFFLLKFSTNGNNSFLIPLKGLKLLKITNPPEQIKVSKEKLIKIIAHLKNKKLVPNIINVLQVIWNLSDEKAVIDQSQKATELKKQSEDEVFNEELIKQKEQRQLVEKLTLIVNELELKSNDLKVKIELLPKKIQENWIKELKQIKKDNTRLDRIKNAIAVLSIANLVETEKLLKDIGTRFDGYYHDLAKNKMLVARVPVQQSHESYDHFKKTEDLDFTAVLPEPDVKEDVATASDQKDKPVEAKTVAVVSTESTNPKTKEHKVQASTLFFSEGQPISLQLVSRPKSKDVPYVVPQVALKEAYQLLRKTLGRVKEEDKEILSFNKCKVQFTIADLYVLRNALFEYCSLILEHLKKLQLPNNFLTENQVAHIRNVLCHPHGLPVMGITTNYLDAQEYTQNLFDFAAAVCDDLEFHFSKELFDQESKAVDKTVLSGKAIESSKLGKLFLCHTIPEINLGQNPGPYMKQFFAGLDGLRSAEAANPKLISPAMKKASEWYDFSVRLGIYGKELCKDPRYAIFVFMVSNHPRQADIVEFMQGKANSARHGQISLTETPVSTSQSTVTQPASSPVPNSDPLAQLRV